MGFLSTLAVGALIISAYVGGGGAITAMQGYDHPEYHTPKGGIVVGGARVGYQEVNPWNLLNLGYQGMLVITLPDGTGFVLYDNNNNLKVDGGDWLKLFNGGNETNITVEESNGNSRDIASKLQPKVNATLEGVLRQNTAIIR